MMDALERAPLTPEAAALLDAERLRPGPPAPVRERLLARIVATVSAPFGGGDGSSPPPAPPAPTLPTASSGPSAAGAAGAAALATGATGATALLRPALIAAFALGAVAGTGTTLLVVSRRPAAAVAEARRTEPAQPGSRAPEPAPPARTTPIPAAPVAQSPKRLAQTTASRPARPGRSVARSALAERDASETLAAERRLVELARTAIARARPADALTALAQHRARFPRGQLAEERDGLAVLARAAAGELGQARLEAAAFRMRYPRSLLLPSIEAAIVEGDSAKD